MRLNISTGTKEEWEKAIPRPDCAAENIRSYYSSILEDAYEKQIDTLYLQGLPLQEKKSDNFQIIGNMERTIVNFLNSHEFPANVEIITESEEAATLYRVVYNFWFASEKSSRMADVHWD